MGGVAKVERKRANPQQLMPDRRRTRQAHDYS
jgi:hypothetical protein